MKDRLFATPAENSTQVAKKAIWEGFPPAPASRGFPVVSITLILTGQMAAAGPSSSAAKGMHPA
jgi:hypothetical protein